ncbi:MULTISPECIES: hypothetical protein [unclassified Streptomyces]|nr:MULTISPECIES: hypothetical protein [unclassified Streptomyces]MDM7320485.1 hypothetical protein [Fervidobacterium sp.]MDT9693790.1 hypothetical protein [Streptomyces sp. P9(2023)]MDT9700907.1 hypothetical protein [Streptomyces sp. P17]
MDYRRWQAVLQERLFDRQRCLLPGPCFVGATTSRKGEPMNKNFIQAVLLALVIILLIYVSTYDDNKAFIIKGVLPFIILYAFVFYDLEFGNKKK